MVGLYHLRRLRAALDDVGIDGPLSQEIDSVQLPGLFLKDADEFPADNLPLLLRIRHAGQFPQEALHGIHVDQVGMELVPEHLHHALRLVLAHQAVVHMDTGKLLPDGPDQHGGHDGGVHAAGQGQQHLPVAHLLPNQLYLILDEILHVPVRFRLAVPEQELLQGLPLRQGLQAHFASGLGIIHGNHGIAQLINLRAHLHCLSVHDAVLAAVQNDALYIGQGLQLLHGDVVGMDLAVYAQGADVPGKDRVLGAAQVKNDD